MDLDGDWDPEKHDQQMAGLYERVQAEGEADAGDDEDQDEVEVEVEVHNLYFSIR